MSLEARDRWAKVNNEKVLGRYSGRAKRSYERNIKLMKEAGPKQWIVSKYKNRQLYVNTYYIRLYDILELMKEGHRFKFIERDSLRDVTNISLKSILVGILVTKEMSNDFLEYEILKQSKNLKMERKRPLSR